MCLPCHLARENGTSSGWWRSTRRASPGLASRQSLTSAGTRTVSIGNRPLPHWATHSLSVFCVLVAPTIDKGAGGSKSVKVNRLTCWRINVKVNGLIDYLFCLFISRLVYVYLFPALILPFSTSCLPALNPTLVLPSVLVVAPFLFLPLSPLFCLPL